MISTVYLNKRRNSDYSKSALAHHTPRNPMPFQYEIHDLAFFPESGCMFSLVKLGAELIARDKSSRLRPMASLPLCAFPYASDARKKSRIRSAGLRSISDTEDAVFRPSAVRESFLNQSEYGTSGSPSSSDAAEKIAVHETGFGCAKCRTL